MLQQRLPGASPGAWAEPAGPLIPGRAGSAEVLDPVSRAAVDIEPAGRAVNPLPATGGTGGAIRLVLGDQLSDSLTALEGIDLRNDVVLMAEVRDEATYVRHHKQKIALVFAAMRSHASRGLSGVSPAWLCCAIATRSKR